VGGCSGESIDVRLQVRDGLLSCAVAAGGYIINLRTTDSQSAIETSFTSHLVVPPSDGTTRGRVALNGRRVDHTDSSAPFLHRWRTHDEMLTVEAEATGPLHGGGWWKFDFSSANHFVAGSITVEGGRVISQDARSIVFGATRERIRFSYRLAP
jgi:hypothetical protein